MSTRYDGLITQITLPKGLDYNMTCNTLHYNNHFVISGTMHYVVSTKGSVNIIIGELTPLTPF